MWNLYTQIGAALSVALMLVVIYQIRKSIPKGVWFLVAVAVAAATLLVVYWSQVWAFGAHAFGAVIALLPDWVTFWKYAAGGLGVGSFGVMIAIAAVRLPKDLLSSLSRIPVLCWFGAVVSALMMGAPYLKDAPGFIQLAAALLALWAVGPCAKEVPDNKCGQVTMGKKPVRPAYNGWNFLFRPFGLKCEDIVKVFSVRTTTINDIKCTVELGGPGAAVTDREYLDLEITVKWQPKEDRWLDYQAFDLSKLEQTLVDHTEALATLVFKDVLNIKEAYDHLTDKAGEIMDQFRRVPSLCFLTIVDVIIDDAGVDPKYKEANIARQNELKAADLKVEIQKKENQRLELQVTKQTEEAKKMAKASGRKDPMSVKEAMRFLKTDKVEDKRETKTLNLSLDPHLISTAKDLLGTFKKSPAEAPAEKKDSDPVGPNPNIIGYDTPRPGFNK